jgi:ribosomal protein S27AE
VPEHLVTIATYREMADALTAKGKLDAAGIRCVLSAGTRADAHSHIPAMDGFHAIMGNDVHLQVHEEDAATATGVLTGSSEDDDLEDMLDQPLCPTCGSMDLHYHDGKHWRPWVGVFVAGAATMATHKREWRCDECGATWTDEDKAETVN